jgi:hypothetical protein
MQRFCFYRNRYRCAKEKAASRDSRTSFALIRSFNRTASAATTGWLMSALTSICASVIQRMNLSPKAHTSTG